MSLVRGIFASQTKQYINNFIKTQKSDVDLIEIHNRPNYAFQLEKLKSNNLDYAYITNIQRDHIDFHDNFDDYKKIKLKIFDNCKNPINPNIEFEEEFFKILDVLIIKNKIYFSYAKKVEDGCYKLGLMSSEYNEKKMIFRVFTIFFKKTKILEIFKISGVQTRGLPVYIYIYIYK